MYKSLAGQSPKVLPCFLPQSLVRLERIRHDNRPPRRLLHLRRPARRVQRQILPHRKQPLMHQLLLRAPAHEKRQQVRRAILRTRANRRKQHLLRRDRSPDHHPERKALARARQPRKRHHLPRRQHRRRAFHSGSAGTPCRTAAARSRPSSAGTPDSRKFPAGRTARIRRGKQRTICRVRLLQRKQCGRLLRRKR